MSLVQYTPRPSNPAASTLDFNALNSLKRGVSEGAGAPLEQQKEVAQQFEALFIQQMLKQARQGATAAGVFDSQQTRLAQSMGDEQMSLQLADPGIGLAKALLAQIQGGQGPAFTSMASSGGQLPELAPTRLPALKSRIGDGRGNDASSISGLINLLSRNPLSEKIYSAIKGAPKHIETFVSKMSEAAKFAANESGVPAKLILSQAALESGWGRREIMREDGTTSHNLFGIKATSGWKGKVVNIMTTEYEGGVPRKVMQPFRAYDSYAESFADYARLIGQNKRYSEVVDAPSAEVAAHRIQAAGYATDPAYAEKLISIMSYFDTGPKRGV